MIKYITLKIGVVLLFLFISAQLQPDITWNSDGIIRHDTRIDHYRQLAAKPEFNCVGRYSVSPESNDYATGILIDPSWVLTAAHFVQDSSVWNFGGRFYHTARIIKHPNLSPTAEEAQWDGWDLALVELARPVEDIPPARRYYGMEELGMEITKVGYGYAGNGLDGLKSPRSQEKLAGQNTIDAVGGSFEGRRFNTDAMVCDFDQPENPGISHFGSATPLELEIGGSKGDSGGGVFVQQNGETLLVGVVSGALNRNIKYGSVMALARVSTANDWIDRVILNSPK